MKQQALTAGPHHFQLARMRGVTFSSFTEDATRSHVGQGGVENEATFCLMRPVVRNRERGLIVIVQSRGYDFDSRACSAASRDGSQGTNYFDNATHLCGSCYIPVSVTN